MSEDQEDEQEAEEQELRDQLYLLICRLLRRELRNKSAINSVVTILKHMEAAGSCAGDTEMNLRRAAVALAEYEGTSL